MRRDYDSLTNRYRKVSQECKDRENQLEQAESKAHNLVKQAQDDAQECISYFKKIAMHSYSPN
jgi:F0F1-type ATP synthase membrane subunit b/b'